MLQGLQACLQRLDARRIVANGLRCTGRGRGCSGDLVLTAQQMRVTRFLLPGRPLQHLHQRLVADLRVQDDVVDGQPVTRPISKVGMVFQAAVLLKWRTVLENVLLPAELAGLNPRRYRERARELLTLVGLEGFATKRPGELSGGMQQRVALCRALLLDPPLLLMDEPFGALDAMTRDDMNLELLRVWGEAGKGGRKTVLFVTHSIPEAVFLSDRVVVMSPRPGRIADVVTVDLPRPRTVESRATAEFGALSLKIYDTLTGRRTGAPGRPLQALS